MINLGQCHLNFDLGRSVVHTHFSKIFFSETARPIKAKFYMKHLYKVGTNVYIDNSDHMTKMAAMPIYGKNP